MNTRRFRSAAIMLAASMTATCMAQVAPSKIQTLTDLLNGQAVRGITMHSATPLTAQLKNSEKAVYQRLVVRLASEGPKAGDDAPKEPDFGDYLRFGSGQYHVNDLGVKTFLMANAYPWVKVKDPAPAEEVTKDMLIRLQTLFLTPPGQRTPDEQNAIAEAQITPAEEIQSLVNIQASIQTIHRKVVSVRTAADSSELEKELGFQNRLSFTLGGSSEDKAKFFAGMTYMFNPYVGLTAGFAFENTVATKGRLTIGLSLDPNVISKLFGAKK